jgi:hypothetical protein
VQTKDHFNHIINVMSQTATKTVASVQMVTDTVSTGGSYYTSAPPSYGGGYSAPPSYGGYWAPLDHSGYFAVFSESVPPAYPAAPSASAPSYGSLSYGGGSYGGSSYKRYAPTAPDADSTSGYFSHSARLNRL